jgi:hypothetical protein
MNYKQIKKRMKMKKKRLMAGLLLLSAFVLNLKSEEGWNAYREIEWAVRNDTMFFRPVNMTGNIPGFSNWGEAPWYGFYADAKTLVIQSGIKSIGECAFAYFTETKNTVLPHGLTALGDNAFASCYSLRSADIPATVTSLGKNCFYECTSLHTVNIPKVGGIRILPEYCFANCTLLKNVALPDVLQKIGDYSFFQCKSLERIVIPGNVFYLGSRAFFDTDLKILVNQSEVPQPISVYDYVFNDLPMLFDRLVIYIPSTSVRIYSEAAVWKNYMLKVAVEKVIIERSGGGNVNIVRNTSVKLDASVYPLNATDRSIRWYSGNDRVAAVDADGYVYAQDTVDCETFIVCESVDGAVRDTCPVRIPSSECTLNDITIHLLDSAKRKTEILFVQPFVLSSSTWIEYLNYSANYAVIHTDISAHSTVRLTDTLKLSDIRKTYTTMIEVISEDKTVVKTYYLRLQRKGMGGICGWGAYQDFLEWEWRPDLDNTLVISGFGVMQDYGANLPWIDYLPFTRHVSLDEGIEFIGSNAFSGTKITDIVIPSTVDRISQCAFNACPNLRTVTVMSVSPPYVDYENTFTDSAMMSNLTLYVPVTSQSYGYAAIDAYRRAKVWKNFGRIIPAGGVHMDFDSFTLNPGETVNLTAKYLPENASVTSVQWSNSNPDAAVVLPVDDFTIGVAALHPGTSVVTVEIKMDELPFPTSYSCRITVNGNGSTGIQAAGKPRPEVYLSGKMLHVVSGVKESIGIYSLSGNPVYRMNKEEGEVSFPVNLSGQFVIVHGSSGWTEKVKLKKT